jgi:hypothetical protein
MIYDRLIEDDLAVATLRRALALKRLKLVRTHVEEDQIGRAPEPKRTRLLAMMRTLQADEIETAGIILDVSLADAVAFGDEDTNDKLDIFTRNGTKDHPDALITATAAAHADVLVTEERRARLPARASASGFQIRIWTFDQFRTWLAVGDESPPEPSTAAVA